MRFWISWQQPTSDPRPLTAPPNAAVLGWWESGIGDGHFTLCAVVEAKSEAEAKAAVRKDWPEAGDWRFCEERPASWRPSDRFPLSDWMVLRFGSFPYTGEGTP